MSNAPKPTEGSETSAGTSGTRSRFVVPVVVVLVAVALIAVVWLLQGNSSNQAPLPGADGTAIEDTGAPESEEATDGTEVPVEPQAPEMDLTVVETRDPSDPLAVGAVDAPIGLVVFSDYQCPYCGSWNQQTLPVMLDYVEAGQLRIEWRDAIIFGAPSEQAAKAAYAAGLQGKFLEYNDALFPGGNTRTDGELTADALVKLAVELGLDAAQFEADMNSAATEEAVLSHATLARDLGVSSTPTFILGGTPVIGAQPTEVFVQTMEQVLATR